MYGHVMYMHTHQAEIDIHLQQNNEKSKKKVKKCWKRMENYGNTAVNAKVHAKASYKIYRYLQLADRVKVDDMQMPDCAYIHIYLHTFYLKHI